MPLWPIGRHSGEEQVGHGSQRSSARVQAEETPYSPTPETPALGTSRSPEDEAIVTVSLRPSFTS